MAERVLLARPNLWVPSTVSHPRRSATAIPITYTPAQLTKSLCCRSSAAESSSSFSAHDSQTRAVGRSKLGANFCGDSGNRELFHGFGKSCARAIFSSMAAGPSEAQTLEEEEAVKAEEQIMNHQRGATKLDRGLEARTVVGKMANGILCTISKRWDGFPVPSMISYAAEESGDILLCVSSLSPHTGDLEANAKCSFLVAKDLNDRSDVVVTITGEASDVSDGGLEDAKSTFLKKHPGAFWVDFGDFKMVRVEPRHVRYVSGIATGTATVAQFSGDEFKAAVVDPISQFSGPIAHHMNADHADQTKMIVEHSVGIKVDSALITDVDSLGFYVLSQREGKSLKLRIPFPRKAETRKDVKSLIVEMLAASVPKEK